MLGLFRPSNVPIAVVQSKELQHHERVWFGGTNRSRKRRSVGKLAGYRVKRGLCQGDTPTGAKSRMNAFLHIYSEIFLPLKLFRRHKLDAHDLFASWYRLF